jgi:hypothetical protein
VRFLCSICSSTSCGVRVEEVSGVKNVPGATQFTLLTLINNADVRPVSASKRPSEEWAQLRQQLRTVVQNKHLSVQAIAAAIGVSLFTAEQMLAPNGRVPGAATQAAARNWLAAQNDEPARAEPTAVPVSTPEPDTFSEQQREHLALILEHDPRSLRPHATRDLAGRTVAGRELPPADVQRLMAFLAGVEAPAAATA